ncbi:MAG: hypothetical protein M0Z75_10005 [Nitrospiraceae bacterium]|nr:hypothetical protein [Nitrospiraceae bacterium]
MDTIEKLGVLSADSRFDLACACGTNRDDHRRRGQEGKWLYPVALPQGGYSVLLKTLLSNTCKNDCGYCPLRSGTDITRCTLQPEEVANVFMDYVRRRKVFGLFLSSGVIGNPDNTMDRINAVARLLRQRHQFKGYIHLKVIPGASEAAIEDSFALASAVSLNIETPGKKRFELLSGQKDYMRDIIGPMKFMSRLRQQGGRAEKVKCTTQFIVGASDETDSEIIEYMSGIYNKLRFNRVYFSAYQKGLGRPSIPGEQTRLPDPDYVFAREHRLYQVDFLMRRYGFSKTDIPLASDGNLSLEKDPKELWASMHPEFFPVRINTACRESLLKVPGFGPQTVTGIIRLRREGLIRHLEELGLKGKRLGKARPFVVCE